MTLVEQTWLYESGLSSGWIGAGFSSGDSVPASNTSEGWADLYDRLQRAALSNRLGIPMIYAIDAVHGIANVHGATVFPHNIGLGATRDPALVEAIGRATAQEVAAVGIDWSYSPVVAVARNDRWGRTYESFGEEPSLVSPMTSLVTGLQGASLAAPESVLATAKHFIGDGGTTGGVDRGDTVLTESRLRAIHLPPFRAAVQRGVASVMVTYSSWNGDRVHGSRYLVTDVLKDELGFDGVVVSDYGGIDYLDGDPDDMTAFDVRTGVNAGIDLVMVPQLFVAFHRLLRTEVEQGRVPLSRIDDAVRRVLTAKVAKGLFEEPFADRSRFARIGSAEHRALARRAVGESVVVLKNEWGVLPLPRSSSKLFVAGRAADDIGRQSGGWTMGWQGGLGDTQPGTTILEGVRAAVGPSTVVTYSRDGSGVDASYQHAIVAVGERPYAEYLGDDPGDMRLHPDDRATLARVAASGVPITLVLVSGRPRDIDAELPRVRAAVAAWLPGTEGDGVTDVLFGARTPTGRLPVTWMRAASDQPINAGDGKASLFPLGHGLGAPPPQDAYATIGAAFYDDQRGTQVEACTDVRCGQSLGHLADGDFVGWFDVALGGVPPRSVALRLASGTSATGVVEVRRGAPAGPLLARVPVQSTGGWQQWVTRTVTLTGAGTPGATGVQRVYLRFVGTPTGSTADFVNVNWLRFAR